MLLSKRKIQVDREEYLSEGMTPEEAKKHRIKWLRIYDICGSVVSAIIIIFIIFTFVCRPTRVDGYSMVPTLQSGDWLLTMPRSEYKYGDIVVVTQPNIFNQPLIKRIIATEKQTIDIDFATGKVTIDGVELKESYIAELTKRAEGQTFPLRVPDGCVFVMGDNRMHSTDSRSPDVGFIDTRYILGKAKVRVMPFGSADIYDNFKTQESGE